MEGKKINKNKTNKKVREWEKVNKNQKDYPGYALMPTTCLDWDKACLQFVKQKKNYSNSFQKKIKINVFKFHLTYIRHSSFDSFSHLNSPSNF